MSLPVLFVNPEPACRELACRELVELVELAEGSLPAEEAEEAEEAEVAELVELVEGLRNRALCGVRPQGRIHPVLRLTRTGDENG